MSEESPPNNFVRALERAVSMMPGALRRESLAFFRDTQAVGEPLMIVAYDGRVLTGRVLNASLHVGSRECDTLELELAVTGIDTVDGIAAAKAKAMDTAIDNSLTKDEHRELALEQSMTRRRKLD